MHYVWAYGTVGVLCHASPARTDNSVRRTQASRSFDHTHFHDLTFLHCCSFAVAFISFYVTRVPFDGRCAQPNRMISRSIRVKRALCHDNSNAWNSVANSNFLRSVFALFSPKNIFINLQRLHTECSSSLIYAKFGWIAKVTRTWESSHHPLSFSYLLVSPSFSTFQQVRFNAPGTPSLNLSRFHGYLGRAAAQESRREEFFKGGRTTHRSRGRRRKEVSTKNGEINHAGVACKL